MWWLVSLHQTLIPVFLWICQCLSFRHSFSTLGEVSRAKPTRLQQVCSLSLALVSAFWNEIGYVLFFSLLDDLKIDISCLHVWVEFNRKSVVLGYCSCDIFIALLSLFIFLLHTLLLVGDMLLGIYLPHPGYPVC